MGNIGYVTSTQGYSGVTLGYVTVTQGILRCNIGVS
jgi:hypothetical protein